MSDLENNVETTDTPVEEKVVETPVEETVAETPVEPVAEAPVEEPVAETPVEEPTADDAAARIDAAVEAENNASAQKGYYDASSNVNETPQPPKKKGKGCLIAILVAAALGLIGGILLLIIFVVILGVGMSASSKPKESGTYTIDASEDYDGFDNYDWDIFDTEEDFSDGDQGVEGIDEINSDSYSGNVDRIGNELYGYIDIPTDFTCGYGTVDMDDPDFNEANMVEYFSEDYKCAFCMMTYDAVDAKTVAEYLHDFDKSKDEVDSDSAYMKQITTPDGHSGYELYSYYTEDQVALYVWVIDTPESEKSVHYVTCEFTEDRADLYNCLKTWRLAD